MQPIYKRMLLKLSGEALAGEQKFGLDYDVVLNICRSVKKCADMGVEIGIVVGGGNFWRGRSSGKMDRGTVGDIGTSSFYPPHHMTMGEGGAVYTDDPLLHKIIRSFRGWTRISSITASFCPIPLSTR